MPINSVGAAASSNVDQTRRQERQQAADQAQQKADAARQEQTRAARDSSTGVDVSA